MVVESEREGASKGAFPRLAAPVPGANPGGCWVLYEWDSREWAIAAGYLARCCDMPGVQFRREDEKGSRIALGAMWADHVTEAAWPGLLAWLQGHDLRVELVPELTMAGAPVHRFVEPEIDDDDMGGDSPPTMLVKTPLGDDQWRVEDFGNDVRNWPTEIGVAGSDSRTVVYLQIELNQWEFVTASIRDCPDDWNALLRGMPARQTVLQAGEDGAVLLVVPEPLWPGVLAWLAEVQAGVAWTGTELGRDVYQLVGLRFAEAADELFDRLRVRPPLTSGQG